MREPKMLVSREWEQIKVRVPLLKKRGKEREVKKKIY
jgi:hypothetical protein